MIQLNNNFYKWFGKSKIVNEDGSPMEVYHGTDAQFSIFDNSVNDTKHRQVGADVGYFFTDNERVARRFVTPKENAKPSIDLSNSMFANEQEFNKFSDMFKQALKDNNWKPIKDEYQDKFFDLRDSYNEVMYKYGQAELQAKDTTKYGLKTCYLRMENPTVISGELLGVGLEREAFILSAKENGYDGVIIKDADTGAGIANEYVVFNPNQIKAVDNNGEWSMSNNIYEAGYDWGKGMSNNAVTAYENGERPLSKWKKSDIIDGIKAMEVNTYDRENLGITEKGKQKVLDILSKLPLAKLKGVLEKSSYHHTGKYFNATDFYKLPDSIGDIIAQMELVDIVTDNTSLYENYSDKIYYHGSNARFDVFDKSKIKENKLGLAFNFTDDKWKAYEYGNNIIAARLDLNNPLTLDIWSKEFPYEWFNKFAKLVTGEDDYEYPIEDYNKHPYTFGKFFNTYGDRPEGVQIFQEMGYDGIAIPEDNHYGVWETEQIHILDKNESYDNLYESLNEELRKYL